MVPTLGIDDERWPAREDSSGHALGDVGGAIAHGRCAASSVHYAMRTGHIRVTQLMTNPGGNGCGVRGRCDNGIWPFQSLM